MSLLVGLYKALGKWWKEHFLSAEIAISIVGASFFWLWIHSHDGHKIIYGFLSGRRGSLYGTLAGIHGTLLGFSLATTAIVLGLVTRDSQGFELLRNSEAYPMLWKTFMSSVRILGIAAVTTLLALFVDGESPHTNHWALVAVVGTTLAAGLRTARVIWALGHIVVISTGE